MHTVARLASQTLAPSDERPLLDATVRAPGQRFTGDAAAALDALGEQFERAKTPREGASVAYEALRIFWSAPMSWKAAAANLAGAGFFLVGWYPEAFEHYVLATTLGASPGVLKPNLDEVRAASRIPATFTDRDLARVALLGREMRQLLFELEPAGASLLRAEMFEQAGVSTWARVDLIRALAANPPVASYRLLRVAATLGDGEAQAVASSTPPTDLDPTTKGRVATFVRDRFEPVVHERYGATLARY